MDALNIPQSILEDLVSHAQQCAPYECCGLLAGQDGQVTKHFRISNTVAKNDQAIKVFAEAEVKHLKDLSEQTKAEVAYFMDPQEMLQAFKEMRATDLTLLVIYHSHTHSPAYPSETDVGLAYYPDVAYLIVSLENFQVPTIQAFMIQEKQIRQIPINSL